MHKSSTIYKQVQNSSKQICQLRGQQRMHFFHWRKHYCGLWTGILAGSNGFKVKMPIMYLFLRETQHFTSHAVNWGTWTGVVWIIVMFLSAVWTLILTAPFTAEDPLVSKWCNAQFHNSFWWRNKTHEWPEGRVSTFSANFQFWVKLFTLSLKCFICSYSFFTKSWCNKLFPWSKRYNIFDLYFGVFLLILESISSSCVYNIKTYITC